MCKNHINYLDFNNMDIEVTDIKEAEVSFNLGSYSLDDKKNALINDLFSNNKGFPILERIYSRYIDNKYKCFKIRLEGSDDNFKFVIVPNEDYLKDNLEEKELYTVKIRERELKDDEKFYPGCEKDKLNKFEFRVYEGKKIKKNVLIDKIKSELKEQLGISGFYEVVLYKDNKKIENNDLLTEGNYVIDSGFFYVKNSVLEQEKKFKEEIETICNVKKNR